MNGKKILTLVLSILLICVFGFLLVWGIINFNKVKDLMSGTSMYTKEDVDTAYQDGYNTALTNKEEYDTLIENYRDTISLQIDQISQLNNQIRDLDNNMSEYESQISGLTSVKTELEKQVSENNKLISEMQDEIKNLEDEILVLSASNEDKNNEISKLKNQIATLESLVEQLQLTNESNLVTIDTLNAQILILNNQVSDMTTQIQNNSAIVSSLNSRIAELQKSLSYYENYIATLETDTQVVGTFEFDGSVYSIQIVAKNSLLSVVDPTSTEYVTFNYWTVNGERVDLSTYTISTNTKFVANCTYTYVVNFLVDSTTYDTQSVLQDTFAVEPTDPIKANYEFVGWTINGVDVVDVSTYDIVSNTTFIAKFNQLYTITYMYEENVLHTEVVKNGEYCTAPVVEDTEYKIFNGWKVNGIRIDLSTYRVISNTILVADITYKYDVNFVVDDNVYDTQIVQEGFVASLPSNPVKEGYEFKGWSLNYIDVVDLTEVVIDKDQTFYAVFELSPTVTFTLEDDIIDTQIVSLNSYADNVFVDSTDRKVFKGWSLDGENIVDVSTIIITANTNFIAVIDYYYLVEIYDEDSELYSQLLLKNSNIDYTNNITSKMYYSFDGYYINDNAIDLNTYEVSQDVVINTKYSYAPGAYNDNNEIVYTWSDLINNGSIVVGGENSDTIITIKPLANDLTLAIDDFIVNIGDGVYDVGVGSMRYKNVYLPESIKRLNYCALNFVKCDVIKIPPSVSYLGYCFADNGSVLDLSEFSGTIADNAFLRLGNLLYAYLSSTISSFEGSGFNSLSLINKEIPFTIFTDCSEGNIPSSWGSNWKREEISVVYDVKYEDVVVKYSELNIESNSPVNISASCGLSQNEINNSMFIESTLTIEYDYTDIVGFGSTSKTITLSLDNIKVSDGIITINDCDISIECTLFDGNYVLTFNWINYDSQKISDIVITANLTGLYYCSVLN